MIRINEITRGRFGNRVFQYNALVQLAAELGCEASCVQWEGNQFFNNIETCKIGQEDSKLLMWDDILSLELEQFSADIDYIIGPCCIHNVFSRVTKRDPREFFQINDEYKTELSMDKTNVGIHIRGGDVIPADDGKEIHPPEYYRRAIELVRENYDNAVYHICTDDRMFDSYVQTVAYLEENNLPYNVGSDNLFVDFSTLTECDIIISSSSTFPASASVIGKKDKKVIHWDGWRERCLNHVPWNMAATSPDTRKWQLGFDNFWVDIFTNANKYYKVWRVI